MPQQAFDTHYKSVTAFMHDKFQDKASLVAASLAVALHVPSLNFLSLTLSKQQAVTLNTCSLNTCSKEHAQMQNCRLQLTSHIKKIVVGVQHRAIDRVDGG